MTHPEDPPVTPIRLPVGEYGAFLFDKNGDPRYEGEPLPGRLLTAWLIGPVHAVQRQLAGDLVLHGNAVQSKRTILILGGKGWGKSSLTAALLARGAEPVADDVLAVYWLGETPMVRPGHPWLKMWPDTARLAGQDPDDLEAIMPGYEKRLVAAEMVPDPVPVDQIVILERGRGPAWTRLRAQEALVQLSAHHHHTAREHGGYTQRHLDACARLVQQVPVHRLSIPDGLEHVAAAAERLLNE